MILKYLIKDVRNQFVIPQKILDPKSFPLSSKPVSVLISSIISPSVTKCDVLLNWSNTEKNIPKIVGLCPNDLKW